MGLFNNTIDRAYAEYAGHKISVVNSWKLFPTKAFAVLTIDDVECDVDREFRTPDPAKALLRADNFSEKLESVEVYFAGVFKVKIAILVNGDVIYEDKLSKLDQWHVDAVTS